MSKQKTISYNGLPSLNGCEPYNYIGRGQAILTSRDNEPKTIKFNQSKELLSTQTMSFCSRYESCNASKCPLDILIKKRDFVDGDEICTMAKATRHRYWDQMPKSLKKELPYQGYFQNEYARIINAKKRWESLPDAKKDEIAMKLRENNKKRMNGSGHQEVLQ
jgi:hypothetical protein